MKNNKGQILNSLLDIIIAITFAMVMLFSVPFFILIKAVRPLTYILEVDSQRHSNYLFQIRTVCKIE